MVGEHEVTRFDFAKQLKYIFEIFNLFSPINKEKTW